MEIPNCQNKALSKLRDRISFMEMPVHREEISQGISMSETTQIYLLFYFTRKDDLIRHKEDNFFIYICIRSIMSKQYQSFL